MPMPLASNTSIATFAAPSDDFLVRVRVLRKAPNAWALITAKVPEIGGALVGEGDREALSTPRRGRNLECWGYEPASPSLLPRS